MPNPVFISILNIRFVNTHCRYTQLKDQTFLFLTVQFSIKPFVCSQFKCQTVLFDSYIGPFQVLPFQARVDLGGMAMKGYSAFPKAPTLLEPHYQTV